MTRIDVHQHVWTQPLIDALEERSELPLIRRENGLTVLFLAGERPYVIDTSRESADHRRALLKLDGLDRALVCLSSPLGIEALPREQAVKLLSAYHDGALALGERFGVWGAIALERPDPADVENLIERGCVGISIPAGAMAGVGALSEMREVLCAIEELGVALLVHPGPGRPVGGQAGAFNATALGEPLWWPALTRYVAEMQAAWLAFASTGRQAHPRLRIVFAMLAGLAPLHAERLGARGGPAVRLADPLTFYDSSSYGQAALATLAPLVGEGQILFGSDRPVVVAPDGWLADGPDWNLLAQNTRRALGRSRGVEAAGARTVAAARIPLERRKVTLR